MALGVIKKLLIDKHCGFISPNAGGLDVFFHGSVLAGSEFRSLTSGQRVEYDVEPQNESPGGERGVRAARMRVLNANELVASPQQGEFRQLRRHPAARAKKPTWRKSQ